MGLDALRQKQLARVAKFQNTPFVGEGLKWRLFRPYQQWYVVVFFFSSVKQMEQYVSDTVMVEVRERKWIYVDTEIVPRVGNIEWENNWKQ